MGGSDQPYMYQPMSSSYAFPYSDFNPKAVTHAHYAAEADRIEREKVKAQRDGKPLINFNQHPDSYMIVTTNNVEFEPMPPNSKKRITWARWILFSIRCIQEVAALGLLICVVCLKMSLNSVGWISRIAPAWDTLMTMYGVYHLLRPAKNRSPYSSASYHFFALFNDTGIIPFYIFIALAATQQWNQEPGTDGHWTSFFTVQHTTTLIIGATWIGSYVLAGLHTLSIGFDLYLVIMFRRIARLPPDMNPLEDNLTSRQPRSVKHKYKNSEATLTSSSVDEISEKRQHYLSGSTLSVDQQSRLSTAKEPGSRTILFGQSRVNADTSFSPHNPETARLSRQQFEDVSLYADPRSARGSRADLTTGCDRPSRPASASPSRPYQNIPEPSMSSRAGIGPMATLPNLDKPLPNPAVPQPQVKQQQRQALLKDNWYVFDHEEPDAPSGRGGGAGGVHFERHDSLDPQPQPQPLRMNPPTPPLPPTRAAAAAGPRPYADLVGSNPYDPYYPKDSTVGRSPTVISHGTQSSSVYSEDAPGLAAASATRTPKRKQYGDLMAATRGVRGSPAYAPLDAHPSPDTARDPSPSKRDGRVISRTGVDDTDSAYRGGLRDRREVSGKVAEEGRSGWGWGARQQRYAG